MERHEAFLKQARSDFRVFSLLRGQDRGYVPECHALHYLQMATEKLAKAAFMALGDPRGEAHTHRAFSLIPQHLRRGDVAARLGWRDFGRYQDLRRRASPLFHEIHELNPSVGPQQPGGVPQEGPNAEYPWPGRDAAGAVTWEVPADHDFGLLERLRRDPTSAEALVLVERLLDRFEAVFR
jgi:hypothetical protein